MTLNNINKLRRFEDIQTLAFVSFKVSYIAKVNFFLKLVSLSKF